MSLEETANRNMDKLLDTSNRGIVLGMNPNGEKIILAWLCGCDERSQNSKYVLDDDMIVINRIDESYECAVSSSGNIVMAGTKGGVITGSGSQVKTLYDTMKDDSQSGPGRFFGTLSKVHSGLNGLLFASRISGYMPFSPDIAYISLIKADPGEKERWISALESIGYLKNECIKSDLQDEKRTKILKSLQKQTGMQTDKFPTLRQTFDHPLRPGYGYCITMHKPGTDESYEFEGEPLIVPVRGDLSQVQSEYWSKLNHKYKVGIGAMSIKGDKVNQIDPINAKQK